MLALAVELAHYPFDDAAPLIGEARSRACGSVVRLSAEPGPDGGLQSLGIRASSCAVGQASAAIFLRHGTGKTGDEIERTSAELEEWLSNAGSMPDWPDLSIIKAAREYPARHGAILLPWKAASSALSREASAR